VMGVAGKVLESLRPILPETLEVRVGGPIGTAADRGDGQTLSAEVEEFCQVIFDSGGTILAGAGGGRFVYDFRKKFGLVYKLNPIKTLAALSPRREVDILVVRENLCGLYQCQETNHSDGVICEFQSLTSSIQTAVEFAAREATRRRGHLTLVVKEHGIPQTSKLWRDIAQDVCRNQGLTLRCLDVDYACYQLLREPGEFDVVVASNCFGDILADLGGHSLGSRGLTYGASFGRNGESIYQTNHGAAWDLAKTDRANPCGQILSLAMLLQKQFSLNEASELLLSALDELFREGLRTEDLLGDSAWALNPDPSLKLLCVGTVEFGDRLCHRLEQMMTSTVIEEQSVPR
jgi:3-isopropylmalate dehydrogenase